MTGLLLIAHAPLASAMLEVARHTYPNCALNLSVLDVTPEMGADVVEQLARERIAQLGHAEVLVLTDVFGATPSNAAMRLCDAQGHVRVLSGVSVPMLWRSLCYSNEPLASLLQRASQGANQGVVLSDIPES